MANNTQKIDRVAALVAQEIRTQLAAERAKMAADSKVANPQLVWPLFFHPIDVAHDWFFEQHSTRAFGRLSGREQGLVTDRVRELLQPEIEDYKACRQREQEAEEASYAAWVEKAGAEMQEWRDDSPHLEDGVDNCNDHGTGEGRWHGRM